MIVSCGLAFVTSSGAATSDDLTHHPASSEARDRFAQASVAAPVVVYVEDFTVDPKLKQDGGGLAATFCSDLGKDKSIDVVCAPDVQQLMNYEAFRGLAGNSAAGGAPGLKKRLGAVTVVVTGEVRQGKHGLISILSVHDRDRSMGDEMIVPAGFRGKVHVKGISNGIGGLTAKYPEFARRVGALVKSPPSAGAAGGDPGGARAIDDALPRPRSIDDKPAVSD